MNINIIVAYEVHARGIGLKNKIPWYYPEDLKNFSKVTKGNRNNAIIMGRRTWESLPKRPLPDRKNIILSRTIQDIQLYGDELYFSSMDAAIDHCRGIDLDEVWIIGGSEIYKTALETLPINFISATEISKQYECDTHFPDIPSNFVCVDKVTVDRDDTIIKYKSFKNVDIQ